MQLCKKESNLSCYTLNPAQATEDICCSASTSWLDPLEPANSVSISFSNPLVSKHASSVLSNRVNYIIYSLCMVNSTAQPPLNEI